MYLQDPAHPAAACEKLFIHKNTLYYRLDRIRQLMEDGQLEYLPVGNRRLTTVQALLDYYKRAKVPAAA